MELSNIIRELERLQKPSDRCDFLSKNLYKLGEGYGRAVFQIDDDLVIKIVLNDRTTQNEEECLVYDRFRNLDIIPKIYYSADDYSWIVSEKVLDATPEDFTKLVGMEFGKQEYTAWPTVHRFIDWCLGWTSGYYERNRKEEEMYHSLVKSNKWFSELSSVVKSGVDDLHLGNFGLAYRNGNPYIVILDTGSVDNFTFKNQINEEEEKIFPYRGISKVLYHFCTVYGLKRVLKTNTLETRDEDPGSDGSLSFTRQLNSKHGFAITFLDEPVVVRFTVNGEKLGMRYPMRPYNWNPTNDNGETFKQTITTSDFKVSDWDDDLWDNPNLNVQSEERVYCNGKIKNFSNYVIKTDIFIKSEIGLDYYKGLRKELNRFPDAYKSVWDSLNIAVYITEDQYNKPAGRHLYEDYNRPQFYSKAYLGQYAKKFRERLHTDISGNEFIAKLHVLLKEMGIRPDGNNQYSIKLLNQLLENRGSMLDVLREKWKSRYEENTYIPYSISKPSSPYAGRIRKGESLVSQELLDKDD